MIIYGEPLLAKRPLMRAPRLASSEGVINIISDMISFWRRDRGPPHGLEVGGPRGAADREAEIKEDRARPGPTRGFCARAPAGRDPKPTASSPVGTERRVRY